jgi:hypothetical protein
MSQEQLEQALAWAKQRVVEFEEAEEKRRRWEEEEGCYTHVSVFDRMCDGELMGSFALHSLRYNSASKVAVMKWCGKRSNPPERT